MRGFYFCIFSFSFIKPLQNGEINLSFTDVGKSCHSCDFFNIANMSFKIIHKNDVPNISVVKVKSFLFQHQSNGTLRLVSSIVPQVIELIKEGLQQGTCITRSVSFLQWLGMSCPETVTAHCADIMELFLDWECYSQTHCKCTSFSNCLPLPSLLVCFPQPSLSQ